MLPIQFLLAESKVKNADATGGCRIVFSWDGKQDNNLLNWLRKSDYAWGLEMRSKVPIEDIADRYNEGWNIIFYELSHPVSLQRYFTEKRRPIPDTKKVIDKFIKACNHDKSRLIWQSFLEDDSNGVGFSQELMTAKPKTHQEAYNMMEKYVYESVEGTNIAKDYSVWAMAGYASSAHILAKHPKIEQFSIERANDDVDDLQTGISFFRGAARQYGKNWGVDLSLWWGCVSGCVQDMAPLYHKRHLYMSWYGGAEHLRIEGSDVLVNQDNTVTPLGKCIDEFGRFTKKHDRGTPITRVAVIMPEDHGWIISPYWRTQKSVWNYAKIKYRQGQRAIDGFFSKAFPGCNFYMDPFACGKYNVENPPASPFALSCVSPKFAVDSSDIFMGEYPIPFGMYNNRKEAGKDIENSKLETSIYRPMGVSHWGDIIDVFTDEVSVDILSQYKVIVLLDQVNLGNEMKSKLEQVMNYGSDVICSVGVITPEHTNFSGLKIEPRLDVGFSWKDNAGNVFNEPYRYVPCKAEGQTEILASSIDNSPLVVKKHYGKGNLYTCMIPWFEGSDKSLSGIADKLFDDVINPVQPVNIEGTPIQYTITESKNAINVILTNSTNTDWNGNVSVKVDRKYSKCIELLTDEKLVIKYSNTIMEVNVPAYDVRILSFIKR